MRTTQFWELGDGLLGDRKQLFHSHRLQSLQFQDQSPQSFHDCLLQPKNALESHKSLCHVGKILLCRIEVFELS
jgi:hypothetical protein